MKRKFPCHEQLDTICDTDYFFWDTEDCATSSKGHFFICERPYDDIGIIEKLLLQLKFLCRNKLKEVVLCIKIFFLLTNHINHKV